MPKGTFNALVGQRIRELREAHGWVAEELARRAGVSYSGVSQVECGLAGMGLQKAVRIAAALGVPLSDLVPSEAVESIGARGGFLFAENRAAEKLGISVDELARQAVELWGHPFVEERDARTLTQAGDVAARSRQAFRGQVTRDLMAELRVSARLRATP